jgi:hypothetical protein
MTRINKFNMTYEQMIMRPGKNKNAKALPQLMSSMQS